MTYIKYLFIYSIFGFLMESEIYKIQNVNQHSGIFYGPYTFVYGFGVIFSIIIYEWLNKYLKHKNKFFKTLIYFLVFIISLSLIEWIGGNILNLVFDIDMWDYSNHLYHFGKYVCLTNSIIWGILGVFNIYYIYPILKNNIKKIPNFYSIITLFVFIVDFFITIFSKVNF